MPNHRPYSGLSSAAVLPGEDRRAHPRYAFTAAVEAVDSKSRSVLQARTSDLGRGGCYVDVFCPFPLKSSVKIRLVNEKQSLLADAEVVTSRIGMGMGLRFTHVEPADLPVLDKWIAELSGVPVLARNMQPQGTDSRQDMLLKREQWYALNELILSLMRKSVLTHDEGKAMLEKLLRQNPHL